MLDSEVVLQALKNTTTIEGAKRAIAQVEPIFSEVESSFQGPQIYAELQRLHEMLTFEDMRKRLNREYAKQKRDVTRVRKFSAKKYKS